MFRILSWGTVYRTSEHLIIQGSSKLFNLLVQRYMRIVQMQQGCGQPQSYLFAPYRGWRIYRPLPSVGHIWSCTSGNWKITARQAAIVILPAQLPSSTDCPGDQHHLIKADDASQNAHSEMWEALSVSIFETRLIPIRVYDCPILCGDTAAFKAHPLVSPSHLSSPLPHF